MGNDDALATSLASRFENGPKSGARHIAFWYDADGEFSDAVDELASGVAAKVIRPDGDEFAVKHRLLKEEPNQNFIVYRTGTRPEGADNWLLDLELAYGLFAADKAALVGEDLGLTDAAVQAVIEEHEKFFKAKERVERLRKRLESGDDRKTVLAKMCASILKTDKHSLGELTRRLLVENADGSTAGLTELADYGLVDFYWTGLDEIYGYSNEMATLEAFVHWLHKASQSGFAGYKNAIELDFDRWRKDPASATAMAAHANRSERDLQIRADLSWAEHTTFWDNDTFRAYDTTIVAALAGKVTDGTASPREVAELVRKRQHTFWSGEFEPYYTAVQSASELLSAIEQATFSMSGFDDGLAKYVSTWSRIDQLYRQFIHAHRSIEDVKPLEPLTEKVENFYTNNFVEPLATAWQSKVDAVDVWGSSSVPGMRKFFAKYVSPQLAKGKRVAVIISDALRFEVADELATRIRREDKLDADLEPILGVLPAYTQMGMAALLPHDTLGFLGDKALTEVDGKRTDGTANRSKILQPHGGLAVQAEGVLGMTVHELRELAKGQKFLYVYHNKIDKRGDTSATERQVFTAAAETIDELVKLVKRLNSADVSTVFITADHGFLFQDRALSEAGYLTEAPQGDSILDKDRRRVIGTGLKATGAFKHFTPAQLNLSSDYEVLIPKGTKRLKLQGSGLATYMGERCCKRSWSR